MDKTSEWDKKGRREWTENLDGRKDHMDIIEQRWVIKMNKELKRKTTVMENE